MLKEYRFFDGLTVQFDDQKTVRELLKYAFEQGEYYEPFGMNVVTLFQAHSSKSTEGWFTTDVDKTCAEEIEDPEWLGFAYHLPGVFYYAEGGWGHHMATLGNHPVINDPVSLNLRFDEFDNTVVIAGKYSFKDIVAKLIDVGYITDDATHLVIRSVNPYREPYTISFSDQIMNLPLTEFESKLPDSVIIIDIQ